MVRNSPICFLRFISLILISGILRFHVNGFPTTGSSINDYNQPCKSGFALRHSSSDSPVCYMVKQPENSSEKYNGCIGNTVTIDFYRRFFNKSNDVFEQQEQLNELEYNIFWTDYERVYENGPFINWRIGDENMGTAENFTSTIFEEWTTSAMSSEPGVCATVDMRNRELKPAICDEKFPRLCVLPALRGDRLYESSPDLLEVEIKYARTENDLIIFNITKPIPILDEVWCFHESLTMTERKRVEIKAINNGQEFGVTAEQNGNYWCLCTNKRDYHSIDSEKIVFVKNKQLYPNTSVMMIKDVELLRYLLDVHGQNLDDLKRKLCPNGKCPRDPDTIITLANSEVLADVKISEKLDLNDKILLHVTEGAEILLDYFLKSDIIFTRKLLFCDDIHFVPETKIGHDVILRTDLCREYKCEGDYIFGAVWKISNINYCEENIVNLTSEEQLNFLIQTLDDLLKNTIANTASLESIARVISNLLEKNDNITIPHKIFQSFEILASRVKLPTNNSQVKIVLPNMAIVIVDNDNSDTPITGIGVKSEADGYSLDLLTAVSTFEDFENISVLVNATSMLSKHPNSRLSFVVYQNEKAFKPTKQIVSVRLGDISHFSENEHIDIKMRLNKNSNGNVCANGEFNLTTNGLYWKTKGCQHLKELDVLVGGLAFCRCNMLSHFALLSRNDLPTEDPATQLRENNPAEQIQYVMQTMNAMMDLPVSITSLENAATMVDSILKLGENDTIPSEVLKILETLVTKVILPKNQSQIITIQKPDVNIAIAIADNSEQKSIVGIKITSDPDENLGSSFEFLTSDSPTDYSEQGILVNMSSILSSQPAGGAQLSFIVYQNDKAFLNTKQQFGDDLKKVNGKIISVQMGNISKLGKNEYVDLHFKTNVTKIGSENENKECVFWDFDLGPTGHWSTEGCKFLGEFELEGWETCRCYHLTHFAQLITIHGAHNQDNHDHKLSDFHYRMLTHISFYGCILSIVGLFIVLLTGSIFKTWRNVLVHKLWMNLVASVGIMIFNFLFVSARDLNDQNSCTNTCLVSGIILHYSVLSTFSWMFVIAFFYYQMTANMFKSMAYSDNSILFLALAFGWLFPLIPMIPLLGFDSDSYSNSLRNNFCYPSGYGFWLTVVLPIFIFIIFNTMFLICILYSIYDTARGVQAASTREKNFVRDIKRFTFLFYQFGLIWIFGLLSKYVLMAYLFCITVSLQGLILSYIFVFGDRNTMKLWRSKFSFSSDEETSYVKSEISSPSNNFVVKNKTDGKVFVPWRKCENSGKTVNTSRIPVCNEKMCSCAECSEEAYLKLLSDMV